MEVKDQRRGFVTRPGVDRLADEALRQLSQEVATRDRQRHRTQLPGRQRHLPDAVAVVFVTVDVPPERLLGELQAERAQARVVGETFFGEDVERPQVALPETAARRAVAADGDAAGIFECAAGATDIVAELLRRRLGDRAMHEALAGHLVATPNHLGNDLRLVLANPAENEERRLGAELVEHVERSLGVALHAALEAMPVVGRDHPTDRADMAVILEHDRKDVPAARCLMRSHRIEPPSKRRQPTRPPRPTFALDPRPSAPFRNRHETNRSGVHVL